MQKRPTNDPVQLFTAQLNERTDKLANWCRKGEVDARALVRLAQLTVANEPKLQDPRSWPSVFQSLIQAAQLGLEPNGFLGDGWIIPRWDGKKKYNLATFQPGYKGLIKLVLRGGVVRRIRSFAVLEGDQFDVAFNPTTGAYDIEHRPSLTKRGDVIGAFSVAHYGDDSPPDIEFMDADSIDQARKCGFGDTPAWKAWPDQMARKTVIRRHANQLPLSPVARRGFALDNAVAINDGGRIEQITNIEPEDRDTFIDIPISAESDERPALPPHQEEPVYEQAPPAPTSKGAEALKTKMRTRSTSKAKAKAEPEPAGDPGPSDPDGLPSIPPAETKAGQPLDAIVAELRKAITGGDISEEIIGRCALLPKGAARNELRELVREQKAKAKAAPPTDDDDLPLIPPSEPGDIDPDDEIADLKARIAAGEVTGDAGRAVRARMKKLPRADYEEVSKLYDAAESAQGEGE
jgi:phage RecT family recombinase